MIRAVGSILIIMARASFPIRSICAGVPVQWIVHPVSFHISHNLMRPAACLATAVTKFFQCWSVPVPSELRSLGGAHPAEPYRQLDSLRLEDAHAGVPAMVKIRSAFLDWAAAIQLSKAFQSYTPFDVLMWAQRVPVFQSRRLVTGTAGHGRNRFLVKLINFAGIGCGGGVFGLYIRR